MTDTILPLNLYKSIHIKNSHAGMHYLCEHVAKDNIQYNQRGREGERKRENKWVGAAHTYKCSTDHHTTVSFEEDKRKC